MEYIIYIIIGLVLFALTNLFVGLFDLDINEQEHIFIGLMCIVWPLSVVVIIIILILVCISRVFSLLGKTIRNLIK